MPSSVKIDKQGKFLFVINPISGDIDKNGLKTEIENFMSEYGQREEFYFTTGEDDKQQISTLIEEKTIETVVAVGGDGTCNLVAQILLNKNIKLGIIPRGSANGLATELELPSNLQESLNLILKGKSRKIDVLQFDKKHISLHLSDIGLNANIIKKFEKGDARGFLGYGKHFFDELGEASPTKFKIEMGDKTITKKAYMIVIANASKYGTGAVVNPKGKLDDGRFEVIVIRPQKMMHFIKMLIPFYTWRIHTLDFIDVYSREVVKIKNYGHQKLQIDGELMGQPERVVVEILPHSLRVIIP
jgi:YegS/Rv2252/BmrU family lipid kinase